MGGAFTFHDIEGDIFLDAASQTSNSFIVKGEEFTDVADYVFIGDRYEIYSVHNSHTLRGNLDKAKEEGGIKSGYLPLYYEVLDHGIER
jgi:hypothetical protein